MPSTQAWRVPDVGSATEWGRTVVSLTAKNITVNAIYYAITLVILPAAALLLEARVGAVPAPTPALRMVALLLGVGGAALQVWCIVFMQGHGGGTPSPVLPSARLVTNGPYAWVRNPLNLGELAVFVGLAAWFASWALAGYALVAAFAFHWFVLAWEEPRHRQLFGEPYVVYSARVNRWVPRRPSAMVTAESKATRSTKGEDTWNSDVTSRGCG